MPEIGKPSIIITPPTTGGGGGTTPIEIDGALYTFNGTITNGIAIQVNLVDSGGNLVPNVGVTQVGNVFAAEIIDFTPIEVNGVSVGDVDNWILIEVETFDKNGNPISAVSTLTGNVLELDIAGTTPLEINAVSYASPIDNWDTVNIDVDNKNGIMLVQGVDFTVTKVGNLINFDIGGQTALTVNTNASGYVTNWDTIDIDIDDKNGNMLVEGTSFTKSILGNNISFDIAGNHPITINGGPIVGNVPNWDSENISILDQLGNVVVPTSQSIVGSQVTLNIVNNPAPSGVAFKVPPNGQTTQYAIGATPEDEGWRWANGFWDYVAPTSPAKVAELDYTLTTGNNFWYRLQQPLVVAGISSTIRFVDVDGGQTWSTTNNKHWVTIDKLTGLMFIRLRDQAPTAQSVWQNMIDLCAALSLTVAGNTYSDWFMPSLTEMAYLFGGVRTSTNWVDAVTGGSTYIMTGSSSSWNTGVYWTATTRPDLTTAVQMHRADTTFAMFGAISQNKSGGAAVPCVPIRKCRNLITAP